MLRDYDTEHWANTIAIFINEAKLKRGMGRKYTIIVEKDEDGWLVSEVVELPGCHTQARDMNQLLERTKEAIQAYILN